MLLTALDHCKQGCCVSIVVYFCRDVGQTMCHLERERQSTVLQVKQSPRLPAFLLPSDSTQEADEALR